MNKYAIQKYTRNKKTTTITRLGFVFADSEAAALKVANTRYPGVFRLAVKLIQANVKPSTII